MNCFRHLGFSRLEQAEDLSLYEYRLLMKAHHLKQVDEQHRLHKAAWLHRAASATKEVGKKEVPVHKTFKDFFDYEARLKEVEGPKKARLSPQQKRMAELAAKVNAGGTVEGR